MIDVRLVAEDEVPAFQTLLESAFGGDPDPDEMACWRPLVEPERTHAAFDGGRMVGSAAVFTFDMTVPGGPAPCAGVTGVSVAPTHRRQGVLTAMMRAQLDAVRDRGTEAFASLWASEAVIYHRFGYGVASRRWDLTVNAHDPDLLGHAPEGRVRLVDKDEAAARCPAVYDAARARRPGMISRSPERWTTRLADLPAHRRGASARKFALYERAGEARGYAWLHTRGEWADGTPRGAVRVVELVALDPDAHGALWRFALGIDLMRSVTWENAPADDPIASRLRDPRLLKVSAMDGLHVRLLDVPKALTTRTYATAGTVTIEVQDPWSYAAGRWTLDASPEGSTCEPTTTEPDLTLSAEELAATYLGDTTLRSLHAAGRIDEHRPGAAERTSELLRWPTSAWCPEIF